MSQRNNQVGRILSTSVLWQLGCVHN